MSYAYKTPTEVSNSTDPRSLESHEKYGCAIIIKRDLNIDQTLMAERDNIEIFAMHL